YAADASMRQRFEQEARVASRVRSAHIVQVVGAGIDAATGHPWLAMELLEGQTLEQRYPEGMATAGEEFRTVMAQLGHGLGAAHDAGVVHRDIKPENIFLCRSQFEGMPFVVKLIDFGIAKQAQPSSGVGTLVMGSPFWMAPEQLAGQGALTTATDVWAVGLLAFRLLTGQVYWQSAGQPGLLPVLQELSTGQMTPPSERARERGAAHLLPAGFDAWFARCTRREPAERFADGRLAIDALLAVLGASIARPVSTQPQGAFATSPTMASAWSGAFPTPGPSPASPPAFSGSFPSPSAHGLSPQPGSLLPPSPRSARLVVRERDIATVEEFLDRHRGDISLAGMRLELRQPLAVGTPLRFEVRVAGDRLLAGGTALVERATA
ncbi:MAG: hypothetical protein EOO75_19540, partial [Myxococcales bacterium]